MTDIGASGHSEPAYLHSAQTPERSRAMADGLDEACLLLNYAVVSRGELPHPSDVHRVLGLLAVALDKLVPSLHRMHDLAGQRVGKEYARSGPSRRSGRGTDAVEGHSALAEATFQAALHAAALAHALGTGQAAMHGTGLLHANDHEKEGE